MFSALRYAFLVFATIPRVTNAETEATATAGDAKKGGPSLAVGSWHACAIVAGGKVKCWGLGEQGQLGNRKLKSSRTPVEVDGIADAVAIAAGDHWTCTIVGGGRVKCWGNTTARWGVEEVRKALPLCYENARDRRRQKFGLACAPWPVEVNGLNGVVSLAASWHHACAVKRDGRAACWTIYEGLKKKKEDTFPAVRDVDDVDSMVQLSIGKGQVIRYVKGSWTPFSVGCAVVGVDREVKCWNDGNLGLANGLRGVHQIYVNSTGAGVFAVHTDGRVVFVGLSRPLRLGGLQTFMDKREKPDDFQVHITKPIELKELAGARQLAEDSYFGCALFDGGALKCWGASGKVGRLGTGIDGDESSQPKPVKGLRDVVEFGLGHSHACARLASGDVACWGTNQSGQIARPARVRASTTPRLVKGLGR